MAIGIRIGKLETAANSRGSSRSRVRLEIMAAGGQQASLDGTLHDLSQTGFLIETSRPLAQGQTIEVELPLAGQTAAKVVWASRNFYGCRFEQSISKAAMSAAMLQSTPLPSDSGRPPEERRDPESFGERLKRLRQEQSISQIDFASALEVSKPTVWKWETDIARPREKTLEQIADLLGVSQQELAYGSGTAKSSLPPAHEEDADPDEILLLTSEFKQRLSEATGVPPAGIRIVIEI